MTPTDQAYRRVVMRSAESMMIDDYGEMVRLERRRWKEPDYWTAIFAYASYFGFCS